MKITDVTVVFHDSKMQVVEEKLDIINTKVYDICRVQMKTTLRLEDHLA